MMEFKPHNIIEELLLKFSDDRSIISAVIEELLKSKIILPYFKPEGETDHNAPLALRSVSLGNENYVVAFTSLKIMNEVLDDASHVEVAAEKFFTDMQHANIAINPGSEINVTFPSKDIRTILDIRAKAAKISVSIPAEYPHELEKELAKSLKTMPGIEAAYLGQYNSSTRADDGEILLVALKVNAELDVARLDQAIQPLTERAGELYPSHDFLEITILDESSTFGEFFAKKQPFFKR